MVVSKRCKICTVLDVDNIPISGIYLGKLLPDLIVRTAGIELDPRKANGVLICQLCATQLIHTDLVIDKFRNSLQRLKKLVKENKPKTPSKDSTIPQVKKTSDVKNTANQNDELGTREKSEEGGTASQENSDELKTKDDTKPKTPKKMMRRKSVFLDANQESNNDITIKENGEVTTFKKLLDSDATPIKKQTPAKATKRKVATLNKQSFNDTISNIQLENTEIINSKTSVKRSKTSISLDENFPMDLTVEEDGNGSNNETSVKESKIKEMNCIICGKVFHQKSALRNHIETSHMGERLKACPHCSSEFRSQQKYESHVFSEKCKNSNHICQYPTCNRRFKTIHKMELHMHEKHSSQNESDAE